MSVAQCPTNRASPNLPGPEGSAGHAGEPPPPDGGASPWLAFAVLVVLFATPVLVALRPVAPVITDADIWWHLRTGQWVVEHRGVPEVDPFAASHKPWVAYSWLFEILVYGLYQAFGLGGIIVYRVVMTVAVIAALYHLVRRFQPHFLLAAALTGAGTVCVALLSSERPWLFTILYSIFTVEAVLDLRTGRASCRVWLLPLVYVLWANTHIQFVCGLLILGLGCAAPVVDRALYRVLGPPPVGPATAAVFATSAWWRLVLLTAACAAATLINPYTYRIYMVVWEYVTQPGPFDYVEELKPLQFRDVPDWAMLALAAAAVFALGRQRRPDTFSGLFLIAAAVLTFRCRRDVWVLTLAALAVLAPTWRVTQAGTVRPRGGWRLALGVAGVLAAIAVGVAALRGYSEDRLRAGVAARFPLQSAALVVDCGYSGPLFNDFNWGGFLIWSLPQLPVVVDGRTNLHGDAHILRVGGTWNGWPGWQDDPDLAVANVVVANVDTLLASHLLTDQRFRLVHEDAVARVFVRRDRPRQP
jgi:hypothetical protein